MPMMGVRERNAMFTQSFFCCFTVSLMTTPPKCGHTITPLPPDAYCSMLHMLIRSEAIAETIYEVLR